MHRVALLSITLFAILLMLLVVGCSDSGQAPVIPGGQTEMEASASINPTDSHSPLGFFECTADPVAGTLEITPLRATESHINAVYYLQGGPTSLVTVEGAPHFSGGGQVLDVDIGVTHPMTDPIWTGFDVRMIFISEGNISGWADPTVKLAGQNQTRLMNSDGYTRWWNPFEFNHGGLYGYLPGILGSQILPGDAAILNGFKYFADGLAPNDDMSALNKDLRGMFTAGSKLIRHMKISLASGLKFNYACDASWAYPNHVPPTPPGDFPANANQYEPYYIQVDEWVDSLWHDGTDHGGNVFYRITAWDWQGSSTIGGVFIEIPKLHVENAINNIVEIGDNYVVWEYKIYGPDIQSAGNADVLITIYSAQGNYQPGPTGVNKLLRSYEMHSTHIATSMPEPQAPIAMAIAETSTNIAKHESVTFNANDSYDPDGDIVSYEWDFNGDGVYGDTYDSGTDKHPTYTFDSGGIHYVDLKVTDTDAMSGTLAQKIEINVSNQSPTACAEMLGDPPFFANALYTFDASCSEDPDGEVAVYEWDFDYDGETFNPGLTGQIVKTHFSEGTFDIMLRVTDDDGATDLLDLPISRTFEYTENLPPTIESVELSRTTTLKNSYEERITMTVHFSDPDPLDSHTFDWSCNGGGQFVVDDAATVEFVAPDTVGHFDITVRVTDLFGAWDEDDTTEIIVTRYPTGYAPTGFEVSVPAPGFTLKSVPDQTMVSLADYAGKVVYIDFWLTT